MPKSDETAFAANWRTVLLVDFVLGMVVAAGGLGLALTRDTFVGWVVLGGGIAYAGLTLRRARRWRGLRTGRLPRPDRPSDPG